MEREKSRSGTEIVTFLHYKSIGFDENVARNRTPYACSSDLTYAIFLVFFFCKSLWDNVRQPYFVKKYRSSVLEVF